MRHLLLRSTVLVVLVSTASVRADAPPATAQAGRVELPSFGLSVPTPAGYVRDTDSMTSAVIFVPDGQLGNKPDAVLMLDVRPKPTDRVKQVLEQIGQREGMNLSPDPVTWGDRPAQELVASGEPAKEPNARRIIAIEHDGWLYQLAFLANDRNMNGLAAYEQLVKETRWTAIQPVGSGVAARSPALSLGTGIVVKVPDPYRPDMTSKAKHVTTFLAIDLPSERPVGNLMILPFSDKDPTRTLEATKRELDENLRPAFKLAAPLEWKDEPGSPAISIAARAKDSDGRWVEAMIVLVPDGRATVFTLHYDASRATEGIEKTLGLIKHSIRVPPPE